MHIYAWVHSVQIGVGLNPLVSGVQNIYEPIYTSRLGRAQNRARLKIHESDRAEPGAPRRPPRAVSNDFQPEARPLKIFEFIRGRGPSSAPRAAARRGRADPNTHKSESLFASSIPPSPSVPPSAPRALGGREALAPPAP
ncbi:hypothetical protein EVAR_7884_1 [Eumeta japonica]|uniref:Uncharacterized protein n=1 Tax=Eumeta variegata TaxID=151549 RepID=A0A4C1TV30_EUMVA|nr:hypothetical protein EVAR_7884_1 [Eumeta japonica]